MTIEKGAPTRRERLFGGEGAVCMWNLLGAQAAPPFSAVLSCVLECSGRVGRHRQQSDPEIVIGLRGQGEAFVDGERRALGPGDVVYLPFGATLEIVNPSADEALHYLIIKATTA